MFSLTLADDHARIDVRVGPGRLTGWVRDEDIRDAEIELGQHVHPLALEPFILLRAAIKSVERDFEWSDLLIDHFEKFRLHPNMTDLESFWNES